MLYIWPAFVFFSWPALLPLFSDLDVLRQRLPRRNTTLAFIAIMFAIVNLNTVIHPFTLADNRHYTFYVFAILRRHWLVKYTAVPVYYICAYLVLGALGGTKEMSSVSHEYTRILYGDDTICVSFVIVWLIATSLSLIAAPLVEPRYFLIPWLTWRLAVPEYTPASEQTPRRLSFGKKAASDYGSKPQVTAAIRSVLTTAAAYSGWLELGWYLLVNQVTSYVFLYRGFEWPQDPGNVQRFMW